MTRAMKDSGIEWIGEIPQDWEIHRNKVVFSCNKEIVGENSNNTQLLSLTTGGVKTKDINSVGGKLPESFDTYQYVAIDNIIMCLFDLDMSAVFSGISNYNGMISPAYKVLKCNNNYIMPKYADYWFSFVFIDRKFTLYAKNLRYTLSYDEFGVLPITIPPMPEQQKIADFLDEKCSHIDSVLEKVRASIDEYKQLKQSVITQAVTKGVRPNRPMKDSGIEWIGEIPANWKVYPLKYLVDIPITDGTHNTPTYTDKENGSPFLSSKDITSGHINWSSIKYITKELHEQLQKEVAPKRNDILLAKNGTTGIGALVEEDIVFDIYVTLALIRPNQSIVLPKFLLYLINSSLCKIQYDKHLIGIGVPNLHLNIINNVKVIITDAKDEQQEIVSYLDDKCSEIDKLITKKEQLIAELETYKKSLIYEYITGKKEVK